MRCFRIILSLLLVLLCPVVRAQSLSVESFRLLENDLTANTHGTQEYDQNGDVAALIKVVTLEKGFVFDGGMLGIVKTEQKAGEIWVYVPFGLQRITIAHPDIGVLRDYYFPVAIQKARTYELKLKAVRPKTEERITVSRNVNVSFENEMYTSEIYLNGIKVGTGSWSGSIAASTYIVEVKQPGYRTYSTTISLDPNQADHVIQIPMLEAITGTISVTTNPEQVDVFIDGLFAGTSPLKKEGVPIGTHHIELLREGFRTYKTSAYITGDKTFQSIEATLDELFYLTRNDCYFGAGYEAGHLKAYYGQLGFYTGNLNFEFGYHRMADHSIQERVYWVTAPDSWDGTTKQLSYDYSPETALHVSLGYGLLVSKKFRLTPQIGVKRYSIKGNESTTLAYDRAQTTYVMSGTGQLRLELTALRHLSLMVTPSYEMPFKMGKIAEAINENAGFLKNWCSGFSVKAGLELYF